MVLSRSLIRRSFMKKIISLMVALALFASTAFAAPISVAASFVEPISAQTVSASGSTDIDDLFGDVAAVPLTDSEAQAVEGVGIGSAIAAGFAGYVSGIVTWGYAVVVELVIFNTPIPQGDAAFKSMMSSAITGAAAGFVGGLLVPFF
jgi:hypothetical protein